jgi:multidrug efflux pump
MKLTDVCIKRPVLSTVMSLVILLLGLVAWPRLQVRQYPNVDEPKISITTQLEGAGPEIIETQITKILENALAGLEGLNMMTSRSEVGESRITLTFNLDRDIEAAANDVRDKIGRIRNKLPNDIVEPRIKKADADAFPFMHIVLYSDRHEVKDIADYAQRYLESRLEAVNGVSSVDIFGGGEYEMKLIIDPVKLAGYHITAEDIAAALKKQNIEKPAGNIISRDREIIVTTKANLSKESDFENLIVGEQDGYLVRLKDVGRVELNAIDRRNRVLFNGKNAVAIGVTKQSVGNFISIAKDIKKLLPEIRLPTGMQIDIATDKTIFIERSIEEVYETLAIATALVILVIFVFLRSWRAVVVPLVTIPLSLIGTFALMYAFNFSVNLLTLLALVLGIGLVVDDAIVMLENIYRHIENGMKPMQAAFKGAKEISFAVIAMTITLAAVYVPLALITGLIGKLFTEFAITLAGSVILSGFVALTLSPMMSGRLLKSHHADAEDLNYKRSLFGRFEQFSERALRGLENFYSSVLRSALSRRWIILLAGAAVSTAGYFLFVNLPTELVPREDQGIVNARAIPPLGANLDYTARYMDQVDKIIASIPEITKRLAMISAPGESTSLNLLKPWEERNRSSKEIVESLRDPLSDITGLMVQPSIGGKSLVGSGTSDSPIEVVVMSNKPQKELIQIANRVMKMMGRVPGVYDLWADFGNDGPELVVTVDRDKAGSLGVDVSSIGETLDTLISGRAASKFKKDNKIYSVKIEVDEHFRKSPDDISGLFIRGFKNKQESFIPLSEVIKIEKRLAPTEISHFMGFKAITISGKLQSGFSLSDALAEIQTQGNQIVPEGTIIEFSGESRRLKEESRNIVTIFGLALAFIFLVLAAQYESWRDPWIIILSVPLALAGGVFMLKTTGQTSNLFSWIGFVTLIGLITKHGILIVDFANKLKYEGYSRLEAVLEASKMRLRPILMTTFAMVMGALPLALANGAGAESRQPIGWVIVGGMTLGTIFTLFVVPVVYTFLSRKDPLIVATEEVNI